MPTKTGDTAKEHGDTGHVFHEHEEQGQRDSWGGKFEFVLTCVGQAVGLGNVWRFPYLCYRNGGGVFLIPYVLALVFIGIPIFYFEVAFGQFPSAGPFKIWSASPLCRGIGIGMVVGTLIMSLYYNLVITWCFRYLFAAMTTDFPWASCGNSWNSPSCVTTTELAEIIENDTLKEIILNDKNLSSTRELETSTEQYFFSELLQLSDGIGDMGVPIWQNVLCLLLVWFVVFLVLIKGIASLGKAVYVITLFPYILITILLIFTCTLEGSVDGIIYYLKPDLNRLTDANVWADAATQIFYSLGTCGGGVIVMSSYNKFNNNCQRDALVIPIINCLTSFYAGFAVFGVLGFLAKMKNEDVGAVVEGGPGLVFITYPEALSQMPIPTLWTILFFVMFILLGLGSSICGAETVFVSLLDQFGVLRGGRYRPVIFRGVFCFCFVLAALPMTTNGGYHLFNLFDLAMSGFPLLVFGLLELMAIAWIYGVSNFADDIAMMLGRRPNPYFLICWAGLTPILLLVIIVTKCIQFESLAVGNYVYPDWAYPIYWALVSASLIWVPLVAIIMYCYNGGFKLLRQVASSSPDWGPALPVHRTGRYSRLQGPQAESSSKPSDIYYVNEGFSAENKSERL